MGAMRIPRGAGTYDATVATTSRTSAVTANVHGSNGFDVEQQSLEQPRQHACRDQLCGDADEDEAQRLAEHEAKHRGRCRAEGHADGDFLRPLPHGVRPSHPCMGSSCKGSTSPFVLLNALPFDKRKDSSRAPFERKGSRVMRIGGG
jgi:hypothetical protein